jgi:hypothetical protein
MLKKLAGHRARNSVEVAGGVSNCEWGIPSVILYEDDQQGISPCTDIFLHRRSFKKLYSREQIFSCCNVSKCMHSTCRQKLSVTNASVPRLKAKACQRETLSNKATANHSVKPLDTLHTFSLLPSFCLLVGMLPIKHLGFKVCIG